MDEKRRRFFKILSFGGVTFLAGKVFGTLFDHINAGPGREVYFKNFKVTESHKELGIYDASGQQIVVIDKEGF